MARTASKKTQNKETTAEVVKKTTRKTTKKQETAVEVAEKPTQEQLTIVEAMQSQETTVEVTRKPTVLFVASEANPFIATGGLADVIGSLPVALAEHNNFDVRVILPLYGSMEEGFKNHLTYVCNFNVPVSWRNQYCGLFYYKRKGVTFYFIDNEYYFKRGTLYGHYDDGERFAFFSRAVLECMQHLDFYPDVMHCHDWQTALSIIYLKTIYCNRYGYDHIRTVFTIHNIEYQGKYDKSIIEDLFGLPGNVEPLLDYDGCLNLMKGAIQCTDYVTTVSPTYANEIKNEYFAHGLQYAINNNAYKLRGILNGIDCELYNPENDNYIFEKYGVDNMGGKKTCKRELQKMLGLPEREDVPIIAMVSRLVSHKGLDLVRCVLEELLNEDVQVIILGKGESYYEGFFSYVAGMHQDKCRTIIAYNKELSSKIYSGADILLMPSKQEPCGLSQMIAARYGTIPVVRRTGGLNDSITPFNNNRQSGNGFAFSNYNAHEMLYVIKDAIYTFGNKEVWNKLMKDAMTTDFTWAKSATLYEEVYEYIRK